MTASTPPWLQGLRAGLAILALIALGSQDIAAQEPARTPTGADAQTATAGPNIYPTLAADLVRRGVPVIDVRSAEEVDNTGRIADAVNIPHTEIERIAEFIGEDRMRTVVLYCGSGRRAGLAIEALRERGYHGLVNGGGFEDLAGAINQ